MSPLRFQIVLRHRVQSRLIYFSQKLKNSDWTSNRVRRTFIDYFSNHNYAVVPSSSVIPSNDRSILFVNSGMTQFKPIFLNTLDPMDPRKKLRLAVNSQKCIRAGGKHNDLAEVGRDGTHHTFFEMLGNWAFNGILSKKEACRQALDLLTNIYGLPKNRLFVTYFKGDDSLRLPPDLECREAWLELGFSDDRIFGLGVEDNFWEMSGDGGPCGPCTEIMYSSTDPPTFDASMELWNIVFMLYNKSGDARLVPLPSMHVDTGMGLERLCCVLQNVKTTYETDLFRPLLTKIQHLTGSPAYAGLFGNHDMDGTETAYRILADHARMFTIAVSDGMAPTAMKAGGILRRIIRNSAYQASIIRSNIPRKQRRAKLDLSELCNVVADTLGEAYPELRTNLDYIKKVVSQEQNIYEDLVQKAQSELGKLLERKKEISASDMFKFHEEYGLPQEILISMIKAKNIEFNIHEFDRVMEEHRNATRIYPKPTSFEANIMNIVHELKHRGIPPTDDTLKYMAHTYTPFVVIPPMTSKLLAITHDDQLIDGNVPKDIDCSLILNRTPFYAEAGGQAGDKGTITLDSGLFKVENTYVRGGYVFHYGRIVHGDIECGDLVSATVDRTWRFGCMQHHTATHLVLAMLERRLGIARQRSSKLDATISELSFWSPTPLDMDMITNLEHEVNSAILKDAEVCVKTMPFTDAKLNPKIRWLAGEHYPELVRLVSINPSATDSSTDSTISSELCCGTHLAKLRDIGKFRLTSVEGRDKVIKTIRFAVGASAESVEKRGIEMMDEISMQLKMLRGWTDLTGRELLDLKNKAKDALIPNDVRLKILKDIREAKKAISQREKVIV